MGCSCWTNFDNMVVMKIILNRGTIIIIWKAPMLFLCAELKIDLITAAANGAATTVIFSGEGGGICGGVTRVATVYGEPKLGGGIGGDVRRLSAEYYGGDQESCFYYSCSGAAAMVEGFGELE